MGWWPQWRPVGQPGSLDVPWPEVRRSLFLWKPDLWEDLGQDPQTHPVLRERL